ncbi:STAS domain-containing protein [Streptomyces lydicus]|uniref:STAS domain-containing protein n=1 Tax=Streptomyces lydicus TaxID=47763 RepID=UPI0036FF1C44
MSAEALNVEVTVVDPEIAVVAVQGDLDADTGTYLHHQLANQLVHGRRHLVLDLRAVPFMDSSGLGIIIRAINDTKRVDGSVRLAALAPALRRLLDLTGISVTTPVHADPEEALAAIPRTAPAHAAAEPEGGASAGADRAATGPVPGSA